jgi:hypothetical protein
MPGAAVPTTVAVAVAAEVGVAVEVAVGCGVFVAQALTSKLTANTTNTNLKCFFIDILSINFQLCV